MNSLKHSMVLSVILVCLGPNLSAQKPQPPNSIPITFSFTAVDNNGGCDDGVTREDVKIFEDGKPQVFMSFERSVDIQVSSYLLIDTSASQEEIIPLITQSAISSIDSLLLSSNHVAALATFAGRVSITQELTSNLKELKTALENLKYVPPPPALANKQTIYSSTSIWDAVMVSAERLCASSPHTTKKAVILVSDGSDNSSISKLEDAIEDAIRCKVAVFTIGIAPKKYQELLNKSALKRLSELTGAMAFFPKTGDQLKLAFSEIGRIIRCEYLVSFSPTNRKSGDGYRKIRIELINSAKKRGNVKILYPVAYYSEVRNR